MALALSLLLMASPAGEALRTVPAGAPVVIARGETVFLEVVAPLRELPETTELEATPVMSTAPMGLTLLDWTEQVAIRRHKRTSMAVTYAILRADPRAPLGDSRISARVDVSENEGARNLAIMVIETAVRVVEPTPTLSAIDEAKVAYLREHAGARASARLISSIPVFADRLEMPARALVLVGSERAALRTMLASRLRAESARSMLRAAADVADPALVARAVTALAGFADPPARDRPPSLPEPLRTLELAIELFDRNEIDVAHRLLQRARMTPGLPGSRLPDALVRLGVIEAARGSSADATELIGQALCMNPTQTAPSVRPPMKGAFDEVQRRGRCTKPLAAHSASAGENIDPAEGSGILVRALFGPDPFHVISRGTVELLDARGEVILKREVSAVRGDLASLEVFVPNADLGTWVSPLRLRARAFDEFGIEVAAQGATEPVLLTVAAEPVEELEIEWWMWVAGGAAILAGAGAIAIATSSGDPTRAIGPVQVRF